VRPTKLASPYQQATDWVFAPGAMKGKQPFWPDTIWRRYGKPAVTAAQITKRMSFHTFRHTYTTLLTQEKHAAQAAVVSLVFSSGASGGLFAGEESGCYIATQKKKAQKGRETRCPYRKCHPARMPLKSATFKKMKLRPS
jgi:hypothetical protein